MDISPYFTGLDAWRLVSGKPDKPEHAVKADVVGEGRVGGDSAVAIECYLGFMPPNGYGYALLVRECDGVGGHVIPSPKCIQGNT